jgi:uncharacterized protein (DUF2132 family)
LIGECAVEVNAFEFVEVCETNARFAISEHTLVDEREAIAVRCFGEGERVVVKKDVRVIGHMCFSKMQFRSLNFAPDSELTLLEERCFELCSVQSVIIPSSVKVISRSSFRKARIETLRFERGSRLQRLESQFFAGYSLRTIQLPFRLEKLPNSCFMGAYIEELAFEDASILPELKHSVSLNVT